MDILCWELSVLIYIYKYIITGITAKTCIWGHLSATLTLLRGEESEEMLLEKLDLKKNYFYIIKVIVAPAADITFLKTMKKDFIIFL